MPLLIRCLIVSVVVLPFSACGSSPPNKYEGPWDVIFLNAKTGEQEGPTIRQDNQVMWVAASDAENVVMTTARKSVGNYGKDHPKYSEEEPQPEATGIIRVWDADSGKLLAEREDKNTRHWNVFPVPSGKQFLSRSADWPPKNGGASRYLLWDYGTGSIKQVAEFKFAPREYVTVAFSADGKQVIMYGAMTEVALDQDLPIAEQVKLKSPLIWVIRKWDISGGKPIATKQLGLAHSSAQNVKATMDKGYLSGDGSTLVTLLPADNKSNNRYQLWDVETLEPLGEPAELPKGFGLRTISHDGSKLLTANFERTGEGSGQMAVQVVEAATGKPIGSASESRNAFQTAFYEDENGTRVFGKSYPEKNVWQLHMLDAEKGEVWSVGPYHDAHFLVGMLPKQGRIAYAVFPPADDKKSDSQETAD